MSDQQVGSFTYAPQRARAGGHEPVIHSLALKAAQGVLPGGLLVGSGSDGKVIPYVAAETVLGAGNGANKTFSGVLPHPVEPGSVAVGDGVETFVDDGFGRMKGGAGGSGTVDYSTGAVSVTFNAAPANAAPVAAASSPEFLGVLDETVDTSKSASALVVVHGSVQQEMLKVDAVSPAEPSAAMLKKLVKSGVYPV